MVFEIFIFFCNFNKTFYHTAMQKYKQAILQLLEGTDVEINGNMDWDIQVKDDQFYQRVLKDVSLGLGESYMEGWWECQALDVCFYKLFFSSAEEKVKKSWKLKWMLLQARIFNKQSQKKALKAIDSHYNLDVNLFHKMLDPLMIYSCGYWQNTQDLAQAQKQKLELICRKLKLKPGQKVLDIGCGWGGFAYYAAKTYGVKVVGITISQKQYETAKQRCEGLPVEIRFQDYRELREKYDRIVSIGMVEHVGHKNYSKFAKVVKRNLKEDGICLLHFIGGNKTTYTTDSWTNKYIFPGGMVPSIAQIGKALESKLILQDWHNFGPYYDRTLMAWQENFKQAWPELSKDYDRRFYKMWEFYLNSSAGSFRAKRLNLWQLVLTRKEFSGFYASVRPENLQVATAQ